MKGGLIFLYKNICDKTNNSQYVIDLQMGVVDSYITFEEGGECIVLQYTIFKKGLIDIRESFVQENLPTNSHEDVRI